MTQSTENDQRSELLGMRTPPVVTAEEWKAAWEKLHEKEKAHLAGARRAGRRTPADALAGGREGLFL